MTYRLSAGECRDLARIKRLEWLLTNGIGGYAMGTVSGILTRRYHGHLIAATRPPGERTLLLASIEGSFRGSGEPTWISTNDYPGAIFPDGHRHLQGFETDGSSASWTFGAGKEMLVKRLLMHSGANACTAFFTNKGSKPIRLDLRPLVACRSHHGDFREHPGFPERLEFQRGRTLIAHHGIQLHLTHPGAQRMPVQGWYFRFQHEREAERGLNSSGDLYCPCELRFELAPGEAAILTASEGQPARPRTHGTPAKYSALEASVRPFLVKGGGRTSILAGYPWFTDWGRDSMISLPGICLANGDSTSARQILEAYAGAIRDGLIPNRFPEDDAEPEYNTADATLWFANAIYRTLESDWRRPFALRMHRALAEVLERHLAGTRHGIRVDREDGLLRQGEPGIQLTWMDVKIDDWVVTPRHGKPVEICGLWVNFLRVFEWLSQKLGKDGQSAGNLAEVAEGSFRAKFWCAARGHYFDTVDPYDASLRPNQVIAMALPFAPATGKNAMKALRVVEKELLTPVGLRTLGPNELGYRGRFKGPLRELDASYHQGTVWPWLLGPYCSAVVRLTGDRERAARSLAFVHEMLEEYGLGGIAECYDGDPPHSPGGCPWQAWSAAEIYRAIREEADCEERL